MNPYIGQEGQIYGVEEHRLVGGKGDGMRLFQVRNGKGLEFTVSADRCADLSRLSFRGVNLGYFSPNGYVAPAYYEREGTGFLKSFTAGFLTTCGLTAVGSPCVDEGESLPLHGTIGNTPAEHIWWEETEDALVIHAKVPAEGIFDRKLLLCRTITCSLAENKLTIHDEIVNRGDTVSPVMVLYHMNMGYPLLTERAQLYIPSCKVTPRNEHAAEGIDQWAELLVPQKGFEEQCYFHSFDGEGLAAIFNPDLKQGLAIRFDAEKLNYFTQWKMMGWRDYVLGLEPGNCHPDGRDRMRAEGALKELQPGERICYEVTVSMIESETDWQKLIEK